MPHVSHGEILLAKAARDLEMNWEITAQTWRDKARTDFEKTHIESLIPEVRRAADAITQINRLLHKAIRECS